PDAVLTYGRCATIDTRGAIIGVTSETAPSGRLWKELLWATVAPMSPTIVYRRSALPSVPWNVEGKLEDYELYLRLAKQHPFIFVPEFLGAWRVHETNTSGDVAKILAETERIILRACTEHGVDAAETAALVSRNRFMLANYFV